MHAKPLIAIGGENLIDTVHTVGSDGNVTSAHNLGGSPFNVALALARQGQCSHYITPISNDAFGQKLAGHLTENGAVVAGARNDAPTTQAIVSLDRGIPTYNFHRVDTAERRVTLDSIRAAMPDATSDTVQLIVDGSEVNLGAPSADAIASGELMINNFNVATYDIDQNDAVRLQVQVSRIDGSASLSDEKDYFFG